MITPKTIEFFPFHKKEADLAIGGAIGTPSSDHLFSVGSRLHDDPAQQTNPKTPRSSSPVSVEKAPSRTIQRMKKICERKGYKNQITWSLENGNINGRNIEGYKKNR